MDNRNQPDTNRRRRDSVTPEQRRGMQQGYPVRDDATQTIQRPINRPSGPREVPESMRQGKIPVRQNANRSRTYPVMNRNGQTPQPPRPPQTRIPAEHTADPAAMTATLPVQRRPVQTAADPLGETREFSKIPPQTTPAVPAGTQTGPSHEKTGISGKKLWILPLAIAILAALGLCIGIPAALSAKPDAAPDYDMSVSYENAMSDDSNVPDETSGAGRDETAGTETQPPETEPPAAKFSVTLTFFDRDPITVSTSEITLGELLNQVGYTVQDSDKFPLDLSTLLTEETSIAVDTVEYGTVTETVTLPYESIATNVQTIPRGQKNVTQYGQNGTKTITYTTEIVNGVEVSRTQTGEEITKYPVNETYQIGVGGTLVGNDGKTYSYSYYRLVNATYYDIEGLTYLGYNADESVVAVDMDYIPLGTKIYVKNDQFDFGVRTAADTGSMIEGWEVDIWLGDSNPQKAAFSQIGYVKNMVIYYLD